MDPLILLVTIFSGLILFGWLFKNMNWLIHERPLGDKQYYLPPGDMGLPIIGNMWSFLSAFKSERPDSYIESFLKRSAHVNSLPLFILLINIIFI